MKKIISLVLTALMALTFAGCSETDTNSKAKKSNTITTSGSSAETYTPLVLNDENVYPSSFIVNGTSLLFANWEDNNKISTLNEPYPNRAISTKDVADFFNYSSSTFTLINNIIYFGDQSNSSNLASINIVDKTYTKLNNRHAHEITSLNNEKIIYLDIPEATSNSGKLYVYDINEKKDTLITSDNIGKYIINNNFILYQNLSDGSKLYKISVDGTGRQKITDYSINSFVGYSGQLLTVNSDDNNNLYTIDPSTLDSKRLAVLSMTDLKSFKENLYAVNTSNNLCKLNLTIDTANNDTSDVKLTTLSADSINEYYPTEKGIFVQKGINVNNPYLITKTN